MLEKPKLTDANQTSNDFLDGRTRWVTDLLTVKDVYPLTNIQENLQKLKGPTIFMSNGDCGALPITVCESSKAGEIVQLIYQPIQLFS